MTFLDCQAAKEIWEAIVGAHEGTTHVKMRKKTTLMRHFKMLVMKKMLLTKCLDASKLLSILLLVCLVDICSCN